MKVLQEKVIQFRDARDRAQYHNPKDPTISLSLEAAELMEIFQSEGAQEVQITKSDLLLWTCRVWTGLYLFH